MHRYVLLCYAMFCSAPIYSTQLYCSILHYTTLYTILYYAYALKRTLGRVPKKSAAIVLTPDSKRGSTSTIIAKVSS